MKNIQEYIQRAYQNAINKGFYECPECNGYGETDVISVHCYDGEPIEIYEKECCEYCHGTGIDPNKNIGELLMLIVTELGEALEAHRKGSFADTSKGRFKLDDYITNLKSEKQMLFYQLFEENIKDTFEDEIADVFIMLFDLCGYLEIDLSPYIDSAIPSTVDINVGQALFFVTAEITEFYRLHESFSGVLSLAGAISRLLNMCHESHLNIPIEKHIEAKMDYNESRPYKHGKLY